LIYLFINYFQM